MTLNRLALVFTFIFLSSCGGSSDSDGELTTGGVTPAVNLLSGVFIDSPVEGLDFHTLPSQNSGTTDFKGTFTYSPDDTEIIFKLGKIEIGRASPGSIITPYDTSGADGMVNGTVSRTARLLQSLDDDGDISAQIRITEETKASIGIGDTTYDIGLPNDKYEAAYLQVLESAGKYDVGIKSAEEHLIANTRSDQECSDYPSYDIFFGELYADCQARRRLSYYLNDVSKKLRSETAQYTYLINSNEKISFDKSIQERILVAGGELKRYAQNVEEIVESANNLLNDPDLNALQGALELASLYGSVTDSLVGAMGVFTTNEEWSKVREKTNAIVSVIIKASDCKPVLNKNSTLSKEDKLKCIETVTKLGNASALWVEDEEFVEDIVTLMNVHEIFGKLDKVVELAEQYDKYKNVLGKDKADLIVSSLDLLEQSLILVFDEAVQSDDSMPALGILRDSLVNLVNSAACYEGFKSAVTSIKSGKADGLTQEVSDCVDAITGVINTVITSTKLTVGGAVAKGLASRVNEIILTQLVIEEILFHANETVALKEKWGLKNSYSIRNLVEAMAESQELTVDHFGALDFGWLLQKNEYDPERVNREVAMWMNYIAALEKSGVLLNQISNQPVLTISNPSSLESNSELRFELVLSKPSPNDISITYATFKSSSTYAATPSLDYEPVSGKVLIKAGESSAVIEVPLYDDDVLEQKEYLNLHAIDGENKVLIINSVAIGTIIDNEPLVYTTNQNSDTSLVKFDGYLYALVGTTTGFDIKRIDPETFEVLTVFEKFGESSALALGSSPEGIYLFRHASSTGDYIDSYFSEDGINWDESERHQVPTSVCGYSNYSICWIEAILYDETLNNDVMILRVGLSGRFIINLNTGENIYVGKGSTHHYVNDGKMLSLYGTESQSAGYSLLNLYTVTNSSSEEVEAIARVNSFWASTTPLVVKAKEGKYEYIWTGIGFNESSRENYYGIGNQAKVALQSCNEFGTPINNIRSRLLLGNQNGNYFEHRTAASDEFYDKEIYEWVEQSECHLRLVGTIQIPANYTLVDTAVLNGSYFSLYSITSQEEPVLQKYNLGNETTQRVTLTRLPQKDPSSGPDR